MSSIKTLFIETSTASVLAIAALTLGSPAIADQTARYDAALGGVPQDSPCWVYLGGAGAPVPTNNGAAVVLGPTTTAGTPRWEQNLVPFSFDDGASLVASVRVNSSSYYASSPYRRSGYYIGLRDRFGRYANLGISSDRVLLSTLDANWSDQTFLINTTTAFHEYRLTFTGNTVVASIDGVPVLSDTVGASAANDSQVSFGDFSVLASSTTQTAWIEVQGVPDCAAGDLDCSGTVDGADLGVLLSAWNTSACAPDLNRDGVVNGADLGILLGNWG